MPKYEIPAIALPFSMSDEFMLNAVAIVSLLPKEKGDDRYRPLKQCISSAIRRQGNLELQEPEARLRLQA